MIAPTHIDTLPCASYLQVSSLRDLDFHATLAVQLDVHDGTGARLVVALHSSSTTAYLFPNTDSARAALASHEQPIYLRTIDADTGVLRGHRLVVVACVIHVLSRRLAKRLHDR